MNLIEQINKIPIINDHTHIFGAGNLSKTSALQLAANILRNNAIDTYHLDLPKYEF